MLTEELPPQLEVLAMPRRNSALAAMRVVVSLMSAESFRGADAVPTVNVGSLGFF